MLTWKFNDSRHVFIIFLFIQLLYGCGGNYLPPQLYEAQVAAVEQQDKASPPPQQAVVVLGSSSIQLWETIHEDLAPVPIISRGFYGSTMNDARFYADRMIAAYNPDLVVIYEGDNDFTFGITPAKFTDVFQQFVGNIRRSLPTVPIYFISIKPSPSRWYGWPVRKEANRLIRQYCEHDRSLHYIDLASAMLDKNGDVREELFAEDGLHLNWEGYRVWGEIIQPILHEGYLGSVEVSTDPK